jgi:hypothetical protein
MRTPECVLNTIEVMYLSFQCSKDALLALGFFVLMVVIVFSTLPYVLTFSSLSLTHVDHVKVLYLERGTWDDIFETFINTDGDPSQFAVSHSLPYLVLSGLLPHSKYASPYRPQHSMSSLSHSP